MSNIMKQKYNNIIDIIKTLEKEYKTQRVGRKNVNISLPRNLKITYIVVTAHSITMIIQSDTTGVARDVRILITEDAIYPFTKVVEEKVRRELKKEFIKLGIDEDEIDFTELDDYYDYISDYNYGYRYGYGYGYGYDYGYRGSYGYIYVKSEPEYNKKLSSALSKAKTYEEFLKAVKEYEKIEDVEETDIKATIVE